MKKLSILNAQSDRFIEAARQLGADEDEAAFKAKLAQIARQKPKDEQDASMDDHTQDKSR